MTPALASGAATELWSIDDLLAMIDECDQAQPRQKAGRRPKAESPAENREVIAPPLDLK